MIMSAASKIGWMARATTTVVGLAIMGALVLGVASTALGANGGNFILGKGKNTATKVTGLIGKVAGGSALVVKNPSGGSALDLSVGDPAADPATKTVAPLQVDSQAKVANLNTDKLDNQDSSAFASRLHTHSGADMTSGTIAEDRIDSAIARDSEVANGFVQGRGAANHGAAAVTPGGGSFLIFLDMPDPGFFVSYQCPANLASNGSLRIRNTGAQTVNVFSENGSENPNHYGQLTPNQAFDQGAAASGEHITFQVQGTYMATIEVFSVHRTSALGTGTDNVCHVQAQALVTKP